MKSCSRCGQLKELPAFPVNRQCVGGRHTICTACRVEQNKVSRRAHPEVSRAAGKRWYQKNKKKAVEATKKWMRNNPDKAHAIYLKYKLKDKALVAASSARRRATKLQATPAWANQFFISEAYDLAKRRTDATGFEWHVDHIVPLKSKIVCGLHVEHNLQVIPGSANCRKNNFHWPDMPDQREVANA